MISIIVPVYNVELYLKECIDSILSQDYTDFELLLIDDGSTDSSYHICKEYQSKDKRVKVLKKTNGGVSSARNLGIEKAKGEWITFLDSDDYIGKNYLEKLISFDNNKFYELSLVDGFIRNDKTKHFFTRTPIYVPIEIAIESICGNNGLCLAPWGKLFRKDIIEKNNIRFTEGLSFCEDLIFCFEYFKYVHNKVYVCNDTSYYYREVDNSLTHKIVNYKQVLKAMEIQLNDYLYYRKRYTDNRIIKKHFVSILVSCILRIGEQIFYNHNISEKEKAYIVERCKVSIKYISYDYKLIKLDHIQQLKYYVFKYLPYKFIYLFYKLK